MSWHGGVRSCRRSWTMDIYWHINGEHNEIINSFDGFMLINVDKNISIFNEIIWRKCCKSILQIMDISCFMKSNYKYEINHWGFSSVFVSLFSLVTPQGKNQKKIWNSRISFNGTLYYDLRITWPSAVLPYFGRTNKKLPPILGRF